MQLLIVAAGDGGRMGGVNKCLLEVEKGVTLIDHYKKLFGSDYNIRAVVGYNAEAIKERYPEISYTFNPRWEISNSAYSTYLALKDCGDEGVVIDADLYFNFIPEKRGYYCSPLKESVLSKKFGNYVIYDCLGWFRGIARLWPIDVKKYLKRFEERYDWMFNRYWCNVSYGITPVITEEKIYEFDTRADYESFLELKKAGKLW
jgi:hypothetical protein